MPASQLQRVTKKVASNADFLRSHLIELIRIKVGFGGSWQVELDGWICLEGFTVRYGSMRSAWTIVIGALLWVTLGGTAVAHGTVWYDKPVTLSALSSTAVTAGDLTSNLVHSAAASVGSFDHHASASYGLENYSHASCPGGTACCNPGAYCGSTCGGGLFLVSLSNFPFMPSAHQIQSSAQPVLAGMQLKPGDRPPRG